MNETQALNICGYFAKHLESRFIIDDKSYHIFFVKDEALLSIHGPDDDELLFGIVDMSVSEIGCFIIDLYDFQIRIDLDDAEVTA